jgi:hypothetical protein
MNILAYVESVPFHTANEALFYCYRAFDELAWPQALRGDIFFDAPGCEPGTDSRALTLAILAGIAEQERRPLDELDATTRNSYVRALGVAGDVLTARLPGLSDERGDALLRQLRTAPH